jgi:hypothetical protein
MEECQLSVDEEQVASLPLAGALATLLEGKINTVNYVNSICVRR